MGSFICEVIYHCTFIIFFLTRRQEIIIYNSLFCLAFFYLGVILNLAWTVLFFINLLKKIATAKKKNNRVVDNVLPPARIPSIKKKRCPPQKILFESTLTNAVAKVQPKIAVKVAG